MRDREITPPSQRRGQSRIDRNTTVAVVAIVLASTLVASSEQAVPLQRTPASDQYVILLKDGTKVLAKGPYRIQGTVALFVPFGDHRLTSIPVESLDQPATLAANRRKPSSTSPSRASVPIVTPHAPSPGHLSMLPTARTPVPCEGLATFLKELGRHLDEFKEAAELAAATSRISLSLPVLRMQTIERAAEDLPMPHCALQLKVKTTVGMKMEIRAYLEFMQGSQVGFNAAHEKANELFSDARSEIQRLQYEYGR